LDIISKKLKKHSSNGNYQGCRFFLQREEKVMKQCEMSAPYAHA
jgi:hypothetical protein